jgi:hypothetical protein
MVMESSPPNMTFKTDLIGPRLASWNALVQRLDNIQLMRWKNEFWWNMHESGNFSIDFMYKALIQPTMLVDSNNKI